MSKQSVRMLFAAPPPTIEEILASNENEYMEETVRPKRNLEEFEHSQPQSKKLKSTPLHSNPTTIVPKSSRPTSIYAPNNKDQNSRRSSSSISSINTQPPQQRIAAATSLNENSAHTPSPQPIHTLHNARVSLKRKNGSSEPLDAINKKISLAKEASTAIQPIPAVNEETIRKATPPPQLIQVAVQPTEAMNKEVISKATPSDQLPHAVNNETVLLKKKNEVVVVNVKKTLVKEQAINKDIISRSTPPTQPIHAVYNERLLLEKKNEDNASVEVVHIKRTAMKDKCATVQLAQAINKESISKDTHQPQAVNNDRAGKDFALPPAVNKNTQQPKSGSTKVLSERKNETIPPVITQQSQSSNLVQSFLDNILACIKSPNPTTDSKSTSPTSKSSTFTTSSAASKPVTPPAYCNTLPKETATPPQQQAQLSNREKKKEKRKRSKKNKLEKAKAAHYAHQDSMPVTNDLDFDDLLKDYPIPSTTSKPQVSMPEPRMPLPEHNVPLPERKVPLPEQEVSLPQQKVKLSEQNRGKTDVNNNVKPFTKEQKNNSNSKNSQTKKKFVPTVVCNFYLKGNCRDGNQCKFKHEGEVLPSPTKNIVCQFYKTGSCDHPDTCVYSHDLKLEPCRFYHMGTCEMKSSCPYSHDPLNEDSINRLRKLTGPCRFFHLKGYCTSGDECHFSHDPISDEDLKTLDEAIIPCAFYQAGKCTKGDDCFYRH